MVSNQAALVALLVSLCVKSCLIRLRATQDSNIPKPILLFAFSKTFDTRLIHARNSRRVCLLTAQLASLAWVQELAKRPAGLTFSKQPQQRH